MFDIDIQNSLSQLVCSIGCQPIDIKAIAESGSTRKYYRITTSNVSVIGAYNANVEENEAFFYLTEHFGAKGLPVPKLLAVSADRTCYLQSDHGDLSLFQLLQQSLLVGHFEESTLCLLRQVLDALVRFQTEGHQGLDYSKVYPVPCFDKEAIMDDLNYFLYYFAKPHAEVVFNENRLKAEFRRFADFLGQADNHFFMYRDFQSRNILIDQGLPIFIDYQGGRQGPLQYDVISLLFQVKAQLPQTLRDELLAHYKQVLSLQIDLQSVEFDRYYPYFVYLRLMQVLGAYGFRGLIQKKAHFIESIPYALKELQAWTSRYPLEDYPELQHVLSQVVGLTQRYPNVSSQQTSDSQLVVTVNSFSYRKGYPDDFSGNGGGFVFDCRALPNPGREPQFKTKTGRDWEVEEYMVAKPQTHVFLEHIKGIVGASIDNYLERHFSRLSVSFGCTGGQHRSVFFAQRLAEWIKSTYPTVKVQLNHIEQHIHE
ncbi:MAG: phosphotransferase [Bacteroidales bacterium]|nr:phosphotransferase [Bacteroidales bacterium]